MAPQRLKLTIIISDAIDASKVLVYELQDNPVPSFCAEPPYKIWNIRNCVLGRIKRAQRCYDCITLGIKERGTAEFIESGISGDYLFYKLPNCVLCN